MLPVVLQLQSDALKPKISVSNLLLKAKVVASKLKIEEFAQWVEYELNGYYGEGATPPEYRVIHGVLQFYNPARGWRNVIFDNPDMKEIVSKRYVFESLSSLENSVTSTSADSFALPYGDTAQQKLCQLTNIRTEFQLLVPKSVLAAIVDAVRQTIMDWSLKLESAGILGDGMQLSDSEKKNAKSVPGQIHYNIHGVQNVGVIGNVSDSATVAPHQSAEYIEYDGRSLLLLVKEIENKVDRLPDSLSNAVMDKLRELKFELRSPSPDNNKIRPVFKSIKSILENATGNLVSSSILAMISKYSF